MKQTPEHQPLTVNLSTGPVTVAPGEVVDHPDLLAGFVELAEEKPAKADVKAKHDIKPDPAE